MAFNAKNLTYDSNEPAFLKRLKSEYGGSDSASKQRQQQRPRKQKNADEEDDDEPIYVYDKESHKPISKAEYDALMKAPTAERQPTGESQPGADAEGPKAADPTASVLPEEESLQTPQPKQGVASIGVTSRKIVAKVINDEVSADETRNSAEQPPKTKRQGPKRKKPKLSFSDE
ncbi:MAG: hypothetical protein Q9179_000013 [Wetmoreana sp. 5 TL-2023]